MCQKEWCPVKERSGFAARLRKCAGCRNKKILLRKQEDSCYKAFGNDHIYSSRTTDALVFQDWTGFYRTVVLLAAFLRMRTGFSKRKKLIDTGFWWFFA
jgi:hypothetical protein